LSSDTDTVADPVSIDQTKDFDKEGKKPCLVVLTGTEAGRVIPLLPGSHTIGRTLDTGIVIPHSSVSRHHAEIIVRGLDRVFVKDLGSTNGTRVNGKPLPNSEPRPLQPDDRIRLSKRVILKFSMQDQIESALQDGLYTSAMRDGLTGAFNKRFLLERLEEEFAHASRHQRPLALLVLDIDKFKRVNDTYGHAAGDQVLVTISELIHASLRTEDIFARYGGEEFVILMRETELKTATNVAERIRTCIAAEQTDFEGTPIRVTVSIGVTAMPPVRVGSTMELFVRADRLLYQAKQTGRNKTCPEVAQET